MLRIRIVSVGAAVAMALVLATNIAAAQTATSGQAGKPLALLAGLRPPHEHKAHQSVATVHARTASKSSKRTAAKKMAAATKSARKEHHRIAAKPAVEPVTVAAVRADDPPAPPPANAFAASVWPVNSAAASEVASGPPPGTAADDKLKMSAIVVDGRTVQVASPDQINAIDLAADDNVAAKVPAPVERTDAKPTARAVFAAPVSQDEIRSPVGSASWIAQVLAALGGAVAAGTVAWFLIGGGPQQMYG